MPKTHTVQQGENLSTIARQYGFSRYQTIWDDPSNEALRSNRRSPHVLYPGDEISIPDKDEKTKTASTNKVHRIVVYRPAAEKLKLKVLYENRKPLKGWRCELHVGDATFDGEVKSNGSVDLLLRDTEATEGTLKLYAPDASTAAYEYTLHLSQLDPIDSISGIQARLNQIGILCGEVDGEMGPKTEKAVKEFQWHYKLDVDGDPGPQTQDKLFDIYGC